MNPMPDRKQLIERLLEIADRYPSGPYKEAAKALEDDAAVLESIERLEERQSELESALRPLLEAKPMPGSGDDTYVLQGVTGKALRTAKRAFAGSAVLPPGEVVTDPDDPLLQPHDPALQPDEGHAE